MRDLQQLEAIATMTSASVLFVGNFLSSTANPHYCEDLADRIETRGWRVLRTSTRSGRPERLADMLSTAWRQQREYDIAHVDLFSGPAFIWAELVCLELRKLGKPYMITLRGGLLGEFARRWPRRVRHLLQSAAIVSAPSDYLRSALQPFRSDILLLPNAIDARAYEFAARSQARPRLIWVRAFHETYNPVLAVETLARVRRTYPKVTLHMLGADKQDGSMKRVEQCAMKLGVFDCLALLGRVPKSALAGYLGPADIFINTTNVDNTPVSVLEAMAAGLCVVSTSVGGIPYLLSHERNALLVPPRDPEAMSAAIERLLQTPELASRLSHEGHELALACDWDPVLLRWDDALAKVAAHA